MPIVSLSVVRNLVASISDCSHNMESALEALQQLKSLLQEGNMSYVRDAVKEGAGDAAIEVLRYNPESTQALINVCECFALMCDGSSAPNNKVTKQQMDKALSALSDREGLSVILTSYRYIINPQLETPSADITSVTTSVMKVLSYYSRVRDEDIILLGGVSAKDPMSSSLQRATSILAKLKTSNDPLFFTKCMDALTSFLILPPALVETLNDDASPIIQSLLDQGVLPIISQALNRWPNNKSLTTSALNLLTYLSDVDETQSLQVCQILGADLCRVLAIKSLLPDSQSAYSTNLSLLLLCRFTSMDDCIASLVECIDVPRLLVTALIDKLNNILLAAKESRGAKTSTYDRHAFGLCITVLLCLTNTSDEKMSSKIAAVINGYVDEHNNPKALILLLTLLLRTKNKLFIASINILNALCVDSATSACLIRLNGWGILLTKMNEYTADVVTELRDYTCITENGFETDATSLQGVNVLSQLLQILSLVSSSSMEAPSIIINTDIPATGSTVPDVLTRVVYDTAANSMQDLIACIEALFIHSNADYDTCSPGITALNILYNLLYEERAQESLLSHPNAINILLQILKKYLPDNSLKNITKIDKLDVATLVFGILSRLVSIESLSDTNDKQLTGLRAAALEQLFTSNIVFAMQLVAGTCESLNHPDLILFQIGILARLQKQTVIQERLRDVDQTMAAVRAVMDMLSTDICECSAGLPLTLQLLTILHNLTSDSSSTSPIPTAVVTFLMSFRCGSFHSTSPDVAAVLDNILVVAEPVQLIDLVAIRNN